MPQIKLIQSVTQSEGEVITTLNCAPVSLDGALTYSAHCIVDVDTPVAKTFNSGAANVSDTSTVADTGVCEVSDITCVADSAGSLNSTYFNYQTRNTGGATTNNRYVWFNVNGAGVDPAPVGRTGIAVALSTGAIDTAVASALRTALAADTNVTITGATTHCIITNKYMGTAVDAANGTASPGFSYSITQGVASNLLNKYLVFSSTDDANMWAAWFNINGEGVNPAPAGRTMIAVTGVASVTANNIASAARSAITAVTTTTTVVSGSTNHIILTNSTRGICTATANGAASPGFSVSTSQAGVAVGVSTANDTVTITGHGLTTGLKGQLTSTGTLPAGLNTGTDYFIISVDANTVGFASSLVNAQAGTLIDLTDTGTDAAVNTFTSTPIAGASVKLQMSNDGLNSTPVNWTDLGSATNITVDANIYLTKINPEGNWIRVVYAITAGRFLTTNNILVKGPN